MNKSALDHLRQIIRNKEVIVSVGAGVSISASGNSQYASWKGLLQSGIEHCYNFGHPKLSKNDYNHLLEVLNSEDTDNWLGIATLIERKLKYPASREWAKWLKETVGSLPCHSTNLIEAILNLELPIITTNYDDLFTRNGLSRQLHSIDWKSGFFDEYFLDSYLNYIFHVHGSVLNPSSVILGISSYNEILNADFVQSFTQMLSMYKGLLFIGYGAGFDDPNFSSLLAFISQHGSYHRHYILVRSSDVDNYNKFSNIYPIPYGDDYSDLPNFIRSLPFGEERFIYHRKKGYGELCDDFSIYNDMPNCPKMVSIPSGHYNKDHKRITVEKRIAISQTPVTVREWDIFCAEQGPSYRKFIGDQSNPELPIVGVTYKDAMQYCRWLSEITGHDYRLPTEIEWEYCAKGGTHSNFWWGDEANTEFANFRDSNLGKVTCVKQYKPNPYKLHDMLGNIWEWCSNSLQERGGKKNINERILKGGCFYYGADFLTPFSKLTLEEDAVFNSIGFRVVRDVSDLLEDGDFVYIISLLGYYAFNNQADKNVGLASFQMNKIQQWQLVKIENNRYRIKHPEKDLYISTSKDKNDYDLLELAPECELESRADWIIERIEGGYMLVLSGSNLVIDLEGGRTKSIPDLITFYKHGNFNQIWNFIKVT